MKKGNQLAKELSRAYASLPDNESLRADISMIAQDLEKNENDQLTHTRLTHVISQHLLTHHLRTESEITTLYNETVDNPGKYKGNATLTIMLGSLFHP